MKLLKGYKGIAIFYLVITIINVLWIVNYNNPSQVNRVEKEKNVVLNA